MVVRCQAGGTGGDRSVDELIIIRYDTIRCDNEYNITRQGLRSQISCIRSRCVGIGHDYNSSSSSTATAAFVPNPSTVVTGTPSSVVDAIDDTLSDRIIP